MFPVSAFKLSSNSLDTVLGLAISSRIGERQPASSPLETGDHFPPTCPQDGMCQNGGPGPSCLEWLPFGLQPYDRVNKVSHRSENDLYCPDVFYLTFRMPLFLLGCSKWSGGETPIHNPYCETTKGTTFATQGKDHLQIAFEQPPRFR